MSEDNKKTPNEVGANATPEALAQKRRLNMEFQADQKAIEMNESE
ncbi:16107_t:CDS:2 [Acaulospora colombiana]|uniref:16107_t:CDS:1 n=1 Tax=Acaulospora colombiana TaxID=27376 RepID=A0ACA9LK64_9GLOM|nr:16107_t:CDS:2 [Acaulospora colombiana]